MSEKFSNLWLLGKADVEVVVAACKCFVTGVKDLSTSVKYMDSKVDFWFY